MFYSIYKFRDPYKSVLLPIQNPISLQLITKLNSSENWMTDHLVFFWEIIQFLDDRHPNACHPDQRHSDDKSFVYGMMFVKGRVRIASHTILGGYFGSVYDCHPLSG